MAIVAAGLRRTVNVVPLGVTFELNDGETLIRAAWRQGYYWPTVCGGRAECTACHVIIEEGVENAMPMGELEARALARILAQKKGEAVRMACRLEVTGPVRVHKKSVRKLISG